METVDQDATDLRGRRREAHNGLPRYIDARDPDTLKLVARAIDEHVANDLIRCHLDRSTAQCRHCLVDVAGGHDYADDALAGL